MTARNLDSFVTPKSVRNPSYEMQTMALSQGYASVRDWAIDQLIDEVWTLRTCVDALDLDGEIVAENAACGAWDDHLSSVCVLVPGHSDPHSFRRVNG